MSALEPEAVWNKSRAFIRRALDARDHARFDEFCFWCAVSLELLGKATLAAVHPALIADPQDADSLFVACGKPLTANPKTIIAKTVFLRIQKVSAQFTQHETDFCMLMMQRRNAELHSGELPYHNVQPDSWAPRFWRIAELILQAGGKELGDWVGQGEATNAQALIQSAATVREQSVQARLNAAEVKFNADFVDADAKTRIRTLAKNGALTPITSFGHLTGDNISLEFCPVCASTGRLSAEKVGEDDPDPDAYDWESGTVIVTVHYVPLAFRCGVCDLALDGQDELSVVGKADEFEAEEEQEVEVEDGYQNE